MYASTLCMTVQVYVWRPNEAGKHREVFQDFNSWGKEPFVPGGRKANRYVQHECSWRALYFALEDTFEVLLKDNAHMKVITLPSHCPHFREVVKVNV